MMRRLSSENVRYMIVPRTICRPKLWKIDSRFNRLFIVRDRTGDFYSIVRLDELVVLVPEYARNRITIHGAGDTYITAFGKL